MRGRSLRLRRRGPATSRPGGGHGDAVSARLQQDAESVRRATRKCNDLPKLLERQRKRLPTHDWICGKASRSGATTKTIGRGARAVMTIAKTRSNASVWARGVSDSLPGSTAKESPSCSLRTGTKMSVSSCVYRAQRLVRVNCWGSAQKKGVLHAENKKLTFPACPSTTVLPPWHIRYSLGQVIKIKN